MHKLGTLVKFKKLYHGVGNPVFESRNYFEENVIGEVIDSHEGPCTENTTNAIFVHGPNISLHHETGNWFCGRFEFIFEPKD